jgi:hypothetical protein
MPAQEGIDAGFSSTYVPQDVAYLRYMEACRRDARGIIPRILFRRWGVDHVAEAHSKQPPSLLAKTCVERERIAELLDMLGLNEESEPKRKPGTCRDCGADLPIVSATSRATSAEYSPGLCRACTAARKETR